MEDSVDETESVKRYNQYKLDFRRQQLQDFFLQHKEQEWFRSKYHPDDIAARKAESLGALKTRLGVFLFLLDNNWLDNVSLDMDHAPTIIKLLDAGNGAGRGVREGLVGDAVLNLWLSAAVIKMEGGTDFDLQVLEVQPAAAGAGGEASGGGGEKGQGEPSGANMGGPTGPEATVSPTQETEAGDTGGNGDSEKVSGEGVSYINDTKPSLFLSGSPWSLMMKLYSLVH